MLRIQQDGPLDKETMKLENVCLLGGSGFVGGYIAEALTKRGVQVRALTRRRERARHLLVLPNAEVVETDVHDPAQLAHQFADMDAVINLDGVLHDGKGKESFRSAHVELAAKVVDACAQAGVHRLLHMSALKADVNGPSAYLQSKGEAQALVREAAAQHGIAATVFRPSVIFGPGDSFLNRFAQLIKLSPVIPLACPSARFQPIFVNDVARAFVDSLEDRASFGQAYDLCGPTVYELQELVRLTAACTGRWRAIVGLGPRLSYLQACVLELLPGKPLTRDNFRSLQVDSICECAFPFDFRPTSLEAIAPLYLGGRTSRGRYAYFRYKAGR
jgi:NADH dehydrogenase